MGGERFSYRTTKGGVVRIFWLGRCVMEVGGVRGARLVLDLVEAGASEEQDLLARITGNFKRGNERPPRRR